MEEAEKIARPDDDHYFDFLETRYSYLRQFVPSFSELLVEVDRWTGFRQCFEQAAGSEPRSKDRQRRLYAALLGQGCNIGLTRMARIAETPYHQLAWCNTWYLREETLKAATTTLVSGPQETCCLP